MLYLAVLLTVSSAVPTMQSTRRLQTVIVWDAEGRPLNDVGIICQEGCPPAVFGNNGVGKIMLPPNVGPGTWITFLLTKPSGKARSWTLISPVTGRMPVPVTAEETMLLQVAPVGSPAILQNDKTVEQMGKAIVQERTVKPHQNAPTPEEQRQRALQQLAREVGRSPAELDEALRALGARTTDPEIKGVVALYENNLQTAITWLSEAYEQKSKNIDRAAADLARTGALLGKAYFLQARYTEAATHYEKAHRLNPSDVLILADLAASLFYAENYTEAEPYLTQLLPLRRDAVRRFLGVSFSRYGERCKMWRPVRAGGYVVDANDMLSNLPPFCLPAYLALTDLSETIGMLVSVYESTQQETKTTALLLLDLRIAEEAFGKNSVAAATALRNVAVCYDKQDKFREAERYYDRTVGIHLRAKNKSGAIPVLKQYAAMLRRMQRPELATKLDAMAESIQRSNR
jgi:tetratricopeptide (TPR) repeat protein